MKVRLLLSVFVSAIALCSSAALHAADEYTPEKVQALVKDLGSEDFEKRQAAEKGLLAAGAKAREALAAAEQSPDAQVKATARKLLARLKFAELPTVSYMDVIPPTAMISLHLTGVGNSWEAIKKSAVGKLIADPALDPFFKKVRDEMNKNPEGGKLVEMWTSRFKGQMAGAVWEFNPMAGPAGVKAGLMAEITDGDPTSVYNELMGLASADIGEKSSYKDVEVTSGPRGEGGWALVGKHMILASNPDAAKALIDGLLAPGKGLNSAPDFAALKSALNAKPDLTLTLNIQAWLNMINGMMPGMGIDDMMASSGAKSVKLFAMTSAVVGDGFEDRLVSLMEGKPTGFRVAAIPPADAPPVMEAMALVPANAVAAGVAYIDGAKMATATTEYLAALKKMTEAQQAMMGGAGGQDPMEMLAALEAKTGVKIADVIGSLKGELGYWAVLASNAPPPGIGIPDIGGVLTCADAEKAKQAAAQIATAFNKATEQQPVKEVAYKNRTIYQVDLTVIDEAAAPVAGQVTPCWAVDDKRIYIGSTVASLQKQLDNVDARAPGLLTNPDFIKALGTLPADARKGQLIYADVRSLLTLGATIGLPKLSAEIPDPDLQAALKALPNPQELLKNIPPMMISTVDKGEQVSVVTVRGPLPPLPTLISAYAGLGFFMVQKARAGGGF